MSTRRAPGRPPGQLAKTELEVREAGAETFRRLGYNRARMEDVAHALGVTKGGLYYYVRTKEELLLSIVLPPFREAVTLAEDIAASNEPAARRLQSVVKRHLQNTAKHYPAISIYLAGMRDLPVPDEMPALDRAYTRAMKQIVVEGMKDGTFAVRDPATVVVAILGMCNWFAVSYEPGQPWDIDEVATDFAALCLDGVRGPFSEVMHDA